ncbi:hypothetical protein [Burkholderia metallica]|nr:hypothetical protein [Burkholderia metallica]
MYATRAVTSASTPLTVGASANPLANATGAACASVPAAGQDAA